MVTTTREQFIEAAAEAFAARGFHGTSIAAVADAVQLTKQALLHHFGSKEGLYGEVLKRISDRLMGELEASQTGDADSAAQLEAFLLGFYQSAARRPAETQLLMRELLDNRRRAETARTWYLKPFLETLTRLVRATPRWSRRSDGAALACVYQLLGAANYFVISEPTLTRMFGKRRYGEMREAFEDELRDLVHARLR